MIDCDCLSHLYTTPSEQGLHRFRFALVLLLFLWKVNPSVFLTGWTDDLVFKEPLFSTLQNRLYHVFTILSTIFSTIL